MLMEECLLFHITHAARILKQVRQVDILGPPIQDVHIVYGHTIMTGMEIAYIGMFRAEHINQQSK